MIAEHQALVWRLRHTDGAKLRESASAAADLLEHLFRVVAHLHERLDEAEDALREEPAP